MKRPEGFDNQGSPRQEPTRESGKRQPRAGKADAGKGGSATAGAAKTGGGTTAARSAAGSGGSGMPRPTVRQPEPSRTGGRVGADTSPVELRPTAQRRAGADSSKPEPSPRTRSLAAEPRAARADDRRTEKRAARERRRLERRELRRFTRRSRNRRIALATVAGIVATLIGLVFVAVYSPLLALRTVVVDGTSRIDAAEVRAAVDGQLGTPLALIDFGGITTELEAFPLIRSYVTEVVPPDTLLIHISEREPVGSVLIGGQYELVDPAGIVLQQSAERIPGVPLIDLAGSDLTSPAFASMVEVLLALPDTLLPQVDSISASTQDDVTLVLTGVGQRVAWGSADNSDRKADLLAALIALTDPASAGVFDVSAPGNGVFRPS